MLAAVYDRFTPGERSELEVRTTSLLRNCFVTLTPSYFDTDVPSFYKPKLDNKQVKVWGYHGVLEGSAAATCQLLLVVGLGLLA